jgi:hypothetical protein
MPFTGNVGVYHLQACRSYPALTKPDRWFCSEEDASGRRLSESI